MYTYIIIHTAQVLHIDKPLTYMESSGILFVLTGKYKHSTISNNLLSHIYFIPYCFPSFLYFSKNDVFSPSLSLDAYRHSGTLIRCIEKGGHSFCL